MVLEVATIIIKEGTNAQFEEAIREGGAKYLSQAVGYLSHEVRRCIEEPSRYLLFVQWESVEAHEMNFRQTDLFTQWRGVIGGYFAQPPHVVHYESVPLT